MRDSALKRVVRSSASFTTQTVGNELMRDSALKLAPVAGNDPLITGVGNELMRDSALKHAQLPAEPGDERLLEMSSCATAL